MSGQYEGRTGGKAFKNSVTMGEALQPAGYRTSAVGICRIWNADLGELITTLQGHTGRIRDVRFSPDEFRIVNWATDDQIIVWDTAKPVANLLISWRGPSRPLQAR